MISEIELAVSEIRISDIGLEIESLISEIQIADISNSN